MKIALIGRGSMGAAASRTTQAAGHEIVLETGGEIGGLSAAELAAILRESECDAVIDFSAAAAVRRNIGACMLAGLPLVEGTTGWDDQRDDMERTVGESGGALVFGANFSIGVNLFYRVTEYAAGLFRRFPEYEVYIEEQHHSRKKDAPSGTALRLKEIVSKHIDGDLSIASTRAGNIPGTHKVGFDGEADQITLVHTARSRDGFARGAIMAAEWIVGKKGVYDFGDIIDEILK